MPTVEERLASLEGRVSEQSNVFAVLRDSVGSVEQRLARFEHRVDARFDAIEGKLSHNFSWTVGIQMTVLVVVLGALVTMLTRLTSP